MQSQPLSTLVLCDDSESVGALDVAFGELGISAQVSVSGAGAIRAMQSMKFDLLLVDLDDPCALETLEFQTRVKDRQPALVIVLSHDPVVLNSARKHRVHFVLCKPFTSHLMTKTLKAAHHLLLKGKRIPFRKSVRIAAHATLVGDLDDCGPQAALVLDISYSGVCLQMKEALRADAVVALDFRLPETEAALNISGQVRWCDAFGKAGIEFHPTPQREQETLRRWLDARSPWGRELPQNTAATRLNSAR
ncbi:MAG TPA: PilZ domain-containing protein [Candidatus Saccharimonadales bacterium]|jgi:CheY-like chemotaxis protein|nr:PilZ domain-containing protein [Candidatus Saccharimonadales bacterium]